MQNNDYSITDLSTLIAISDIQARQNVVWAGRTQYNCQEDFGPDTISYGYQMPLKHYRVAGIIFRY